MLRPRLGLRIEDSTGRALQQLDAPTARRVKISAETRNAILEGLHGAASAPGGTSTPVFEGFPIPIAGKTGTAEHVGKPDQSWYVALAPYPNPRYVVAVTDEAGGFGADTAAPMTRRILAALFDVKETGPRPGRRGARLMQASAATAVKDFRDDARARFLRIDPLMLVATVGPDRRQHLHRRERYPGRIAGRPQLLPLPAGGVRRRRVRAHAAHHPASTTRACASGSSASTGS